MFKNIYIHFPYCLYKCHYCDFNSYAYEQQNIPHQDYQSALMSEIQYWHKKFPEKRDIDTVFFGGGTPSLMKPHCVAELLERIDQNWGLAANAEITLESNPGTVTKKSFADFKSAGINRISLGVQSFQEKNLKRFGRIHTGDEASLAIENARSVFDNVSCDLIFGFPDQTVAEWNLDLQKAISFDLAHMSCYALTNEPQTQFAVDVKNNKYKELPSDVMAEMQNLTYDQLNKNGFSAYEISNFAKPNKESRHNLCYWHYESYLALGAGATAQFIFGQEEARVTERHTNFKRPQDYAQALLEKKDFFTREKISYPVNVFEYLMMNLRLRSGLTVLDFKQKWGLATWQKIEIQILKLVNQGLLEATPSHFLLTKKGFLLNHQVLSEFLGLL